MLKLLNLVELSQTNSYMPVYATLSKPICLSLRYFLGRNFMAQSTIIKALFSESSDIIFDLALAWFLERTICFFQSKISPSALRSFNFCWMVSRTFVNIWQFFHPLLCEWSKQSFCSSLSWSLRTNDRQWSGISDFVSKWT